MATENKTTPPPAPKGPSLSDVQARDGFIAAALREIVAAQVADNKWNADMAGTWAVRYANAVMVARAAETTPLNVVVAKNEKPAPTTAAVATVPAGGTVIKSELERNMESLSKEPPKSIAEIIGESEPCVEVK